MSFAETKRIYTGRTVMFTQRVADCEVYAEPFMKARILNMTSEHDGEVVCLDVDFSEFAEYNKQFESFNYYDADGVARLNAHEAGCYTARDSIYIDGEQTSPMSEWAVLVDDFESYFEKREDQLFLREGFIATCKSAHFGEGTQFRVVTGVDGDKVRIAGLIGQYDIGDIEIHKLVRML